MWSPYRAVSIPPPFLPPHSVRSGSLSSGSIVRRIPRIPQTDDTQIHPVRKSTMTHRNNDIENTPVVVVAESAEEEADTGAGRTDRCLKPICYSPFYYYYKLVLAIIGLGSALARWIGYTKDCSEWSDAMLPQAFFYTVIILYVWIILAHGFFIIARFVTKHPPSDTLYDGKFASILKLPLMMSYVILLVVGIVGLVVIHAPVSESQTCADELYETVYTEGITVIVISILMLLRITGLRQRYNFLKYIS